MVMVDTGSTGRMEEVDRALAELVFVGRIVGVVGFGMLAVIVGSRWTWIGLEIHAGFHRVVSSPGMGFVGGASGNPHVFWTLAPVMELSLSMDNNIVQPTWTDWTTIDYLVNRTLSPLTRIVGLALGRVHMSVHLPPRASGAPGTFVTSGQATGFLDNMVTIAAVVMMVMVHLGSGSGPKKKRYSVVISMVH